MNYFDKNCHLVLLILLLFFKPIGPICAQERVLFLKEGRLWETLNLGKTGPMFNNWQRSGYGMDYPGYDKEWIAGHIGDPPSHHVGGGFWIGALSDSGEVLGREDYALYAGSVGFESTAKYIAEQHESVFEDQSNYFLQSNPHKGELFLKTCYQWNPDYIFPYERRAYLPMRVERAVHQWVTHQFDQDYMIFDYTITNVGDTTMHKTFIMFMYGFSINTRGWSVLFTDYNQGARNNRMIWDPVKRMMYGYATNFKDEEGDETYDFWEKGGPDREGEYLAPGYAGIKFLYISPDSSGQANRVHDYGWAASHPTQASHPFTDKGSLELDYAVIRNPAQATDAITSMGDPRWGKSRIWSMVTLGPWTLAPGDSIQVVMAELVGAVPYSTAVDPEATTSDIAKGRNILYQLADRAQQNYDNGYDIPDPPAAPLDFELEHMQAQVGARITWSDQAENIPDPDYTGAEAHDLAEYHIYRSNYLPIGPWELIGSVSEGELEFYDSVTETYQFLDTTQTLGESYYYAITTSDTGHANWPIDPGQYPQGVPALESSRYINRTIQPFRAGIGPSDDLAQVTVVPNPFVISSGLTIPGDEDIIQFINVPSPCVIRIYTMRGDLVQTIRHTQQVGTATWDQVSQWGQYVESGVYLYHITSQAPTSQGEVITGKFSIIR